MKVLFCALLSKFYFNINGLYLLIYKIYLSENKYEPLKVPAECQVGDKIIIEGFDATGEVAQLNPKKKVWDKIQAELKTNGSGEVLWKEFNMLSISGARITSTLANCNIK